MSATGSAIVAGSELRLGARAGKRNWTAAVGFWSAILTTMAIVVFDVSMPIGFAGIDVTVLTLAASFAIAPAFVALIVSLHYRAAPQHRVWTGIAIAYAGIYATLIIFNYMLQLTVVRQDPDGYRWLSMALDGTTAFWVFELFGYGFMCLAAVFAIPGMLGARFERAIVALFAVNLVSAVAGIVVYMVTIRPDHPAILSGLVLWGVLFPIGTGLLALQFRSEMRVATVHL